MNNKILVVEDEDSIRKFVTINLERAGFEVKQANNAEDGIEIARNEDIDIVILDVMLPGIDGFEACKILREEIPSLGIIMLTAKTQDIDKIMGLEQGSDDYMTKPFNPTELVLRVKSLFRRMDFKQEEDSDKILKYDCFKIDKYSRKFYKDDMEMDLTPTEFSIIKLFIENPGRAFKRDEILNLVWGNDFIGDSKIVDVNIRRLRSKIEADPGEPYYIETIWGLGYRWKKID